MLAGQAQKEAFVNEAHALTDALLHCAIEGETATPPSVAVEGECWLVAAAASGAWLGQDGKLACRQGGNWLFVTPRDGLRVLDRSNGRDMRYRGAWLTPAEPDEPSGGSVIDSEARAAIAQILVALRQAGVFAAA